MNTNIGEKGQWLEQRIVQFWYANMTQTLYRILSFLVSKHHIGFNKCLHSPSFLMGEEMPFDPKTTGTNCSASWVGPNNMTICSAAPFSWWIQVK